MTASCWTKKATRRPSGCAEAHMERSANRELANFLRRLQWALCALAVGWLLWLLAPVLTPFVFAALLGWLGDPLAARTERRGPARNTAVGIVFAAMALLV